MWVNAVLWWPGALVESRGSMRCSLAEGLGFKVEA